MLHRYRVEYVFGLQVIFADKGPALLELVVPSGDECVTPVPEWAGKAKGTGREFAHTGVNLGSCLSGKIVRKFAVIDGGITA